MTLCELNEAHQRLGDEVRAYAQSVIAPRADELDARGEFPRTFLREMAAKGWLGIPFPSAYGGLGLDCRSYIVALEALAQVCPSTAITIAAHCSLACFPIYAYGTEEQKRRFLPALLRGDKIGAFGLTEPLAGSDAGATQTTVQRSNGHWLINGQKRFITNASYADVVVFTASHDPSLKTRGISAFIVERGSPGFSAGRKEDKLGLRASDTAELWFEECRLPLENLLGPEREGFKIFMETLDGGRISIGALGLGIAEGALQHALAFLNGEDRDAHKLRRLQWVQELIAETATEIECARHLVYHAAYLKDQGARITLESAMAKLYASEVGTRACRRLMDIIGPEAMLHLHPLQRLLRDAKLMEIGEGTSQIQKLVIARGILGK